MPLETVAWRNGTLHIIDQTRLPGAYEIVPLETVEAVWHAIRTLQVRGAPAIGVAAAFGVVIGAQHTSGDATGAIATAAREAATYLATSRPTAVNLFWALDRMRRCVDAHADGAGLRAALEREAVTMLEEDTATCRAIGAAGAPLIAEGAGVLTHCNAGGLATASYGTALAVMYTAHEAGRRFHVYADETRPLLQGARLTTWELMQAGIDVTLICDNAAAHVMQQGKVQLVITGADRIAANGDAANKIGTYGVALLADAHQIPFYIAAPLSTFDFDTPDGTGIPIEERAAEEVTEGFGTRTAPEGVQVFSPAFDVTPHRLIHGFITEHGLIHPPYAESFATLQAVAAPAH